MIWVWIYIIGYFAFFTIAVTWAPAFWDNHHRPPACLIGLAWPFTILYTIEVGAREQRQRQQAELAEAERWLAQIGQPEDRGSRL